MLHLFCIFLQNGISLLKTFTLKFLCFELATLVYLVAGDKTARVSDITFFALLAWFVD